MRHDASDDVAPLFQACAFCIFQRVALADYAFRVQPEGYDLALEGNHRLEDFVLRHFCHLRTTRRVHLFYLSRAENRTRADFEEQKSRATHDRRFKDLSCSADTTVGFAKSRNPC